MTRFKIIGSNPPSIRFIDGRVDTGIYRVVDMIWLIEQIRRYPSKSLYSDAMSALNTVKE